MRKIFTILLAATASVVTFAQEAKEKKNPLTVETHYRFLENGGELGLMVGRANGLFVDVSSTIPTKDNGKQSMWTATVGYAPTYWVNDQMFIQGLVGVGVMKTDAMPYNYSITLYPRIGYAPCENMILTLGYNHNFTQDKDFKQDLETGKFDAHNITLSVGYRFDKGTKASDCDLAGTAMHFRPVENGGEFGVMIGKANGAFADFSYSYPTKKNGKTGTWSVTAGYAPTYNINENLFAQALVGVGISSTMSKTPSYNGNEGSTDSETRQYTLMVYPRIGYKFNNKLCLSLGYLHNFTQDLKFEQDIEVGKLDWHDTALSIGYNF